MSRYFTPFQKLILGVAGLGVMLLILYLMRSILTPLALSLALTFMLNPLVNALERAGLPRVVGVILALGLLAALLGLGGYFLFPKAYLQILSLRADLPVYMDTLKQHGLQAQKSLHRSFPWIQQINFVSQGVDALHMLVIRLFQDIPTIISSVFSILAIFLLMPITTFFLLKDGHQIKRAFLQSVPNRYFERVLNVVYRVEYQTVAYVRGLLLESLLVGAMSTIGLLILDVKYALVIGMLAGFANMVPYLGPVVGAVPAVLFTLMDPSGSPWWLVVLMFYIVQIIDNNLLQPLIYGRSLNLHPIMIMFAIILGSQWAGLWGMLLAVPTLGILKVFVQELAKELRYRLV